MYVKTELTIKLSEYLFSIEKIYLIMTFFNSLLVAE